MDKQNIVALFPGQGSQVVGMGKDFFDAGEFGRELFEQADNALGFSLSQLCFEGPIEKLTATEFVQPAILTVSTICYQSFMAKHAGNFNVVAAAGHSLGEYSALVAAGAISFEDAVVLVNKRGRYMQEAVPAGQGKMVAVLGKDVSDIKIALAQVSDANKDGVQIANINAIGQVVISGYVVAVDEFLHVLGPAKTVELTVSAPFHCKLMAPAAEKLSRDLDALTINPANFPVYCNVTGHAVSEPEEIRENLKQQVCGSVLWVDCMQNIISELKPHFSYEFGTGNVLTNLLKRIDKSLDRKTISSLGDITSIA